MDLTFLGAAGTVTGSRFLVSHNGYRLLVDCGLFQGLKQLRKRNWAPFPVDPARIDEIILTHAHLDHTGYLPVLVRDGFRGSVHCTPATADLCGILLPDSGYLQEEEAARANRYGYTKHKPALPLYTREDAERALERLSLVPLRHITETAGGMRFRFDRAGHILGSATVVLEGERTIAFSGDLGRMRDPLMKSPERIRAADYLVLESTYGDRAHPREDPGDVLAEAINRTVARGGVIIIPSFAVGRAQSVLYQLAVLRARNEIPRIPIYIDSPMAADATRLFQAHADEHRLSTPQIVAMSQTARITNSADESKALDRDNDPKIIISASGMATGGRVLFHLARFAPDPRNTVLFVGYQAAGTRGAAMAAGAKAIKIHGNYVPVRAEVRVIDGMSAHADAEEILEWLGGFERPPRRTFLVHGEPAAADALRLAIQDRLGWEVHVAEHNERVEL